MTRKKQQPTVVKMEVEDQLNLSSTTATNINQDNQGSIDELDTSQIMALLEKSMPDGILKNGRLMEEREMSPLTPAKANEILFAAGIRPHKKTSEIWEHYKCLNEKQNVECIYCWKVLKRNDSSTKSMWGHMNAYHQDILKDGMTKKKLKRSATTTTTTTTTTKTNEQLEETPTQPYVKRVRGGVVNGSGGTLSSNNSMMMLDQKPMIDSMAFALQQLQQGGNLADFNTSLNFLESLPKSSEVINISGGFIKEEIDEDMENHVEAASSSSSDEPIRNSDSPSDMRKSVSPVRNGNNALSQQDVSELSNNQLAAFVNLASTNPMMLAMLNAANSSSPPTNGEVQPSTSPPPPSGNPPSVKDYSIDKKDPSSFSLSDGPCAAVLMSMALDLDMTMSYHRRRVDIELCFESNRTAEKSGGRGKVICLTDLGKEIKIIERVNGAVVDTELWTKTDFNQFHWAIRGKCQKCFIKA